MRTRRVVTTVATGVSQRAKLIKNRAVVNENMTGSAQACARPTAALAYPHPATTLHNHTFYTPVTHRLERWRSAGG